MPENSSHHNIPEYSVTEVSFALKQTVEERFPHIRVRGEISGYKRAPSGHVYLTLKDDQSALAAVCWKGTADKLPFKPEDGLEVVCTGRMTTYGGQSKYQLIVEYMEPAGVGALMALLEKRKAQLAKEGLFDEKRKKPLPFLPEVIGVVTSPTGAVIRDILHRLEERFPRHVLLWPVLVQGERAAEQITAAIKGFNAIKAGGKVPRPDVLIVARGGGSIEDLWPFNEENVARAVAASEIPVISAVGHETDTTLIDYVSDRRAPTPTAAAEFAVPVRAELLAYVQQQGGRLVQGWQRVSEDLGKRVAQAARILPGVVRLLEYAEQRGDTVFTRLLGALPRFMQQKQLKYTSIASHLKPKALQQDIAQKSKELDRHSQQLQRSAERQLEKLEQRLNQASRLMESYHYKKVLQRGFALVWDGKQVVTSASDVPENSSLSLEFKDGRKTVYTNVAAKKSPKKKAQIPTQQESLF